MTKRQKCTNFLKIKKKVIYDSFSVKESIHTLNIEEVYYGEQEDLHGEPLIKKKKKKIRYCSAVIER